MLADDMLKHLQAKIDEGAEASLLQFLGEDALIKPIATLLVRSLRKNQDLLQV
jgi:hypothetical protein